MSVESIREEMREAIKSVAEQTQYVRENLHKPFNGSTKFVTIATVTGLGAFYALNDQAIMDPIESSFQKDILALQRDLDEHKAAEAHPTAAKMIVTLQGGNAEQQRQIIALCKILAQRLATLEHKAGLLVHQRSCGVLNPISRK